MADSLGKTINKKYLSFTEVILDPDNKYKPEFDIMKDKKNFIVSNTKFETQLGWINFYPFWKKYVFTTISKSIILDLTCLNEIANFIEEIQ